jgi:tRNA(adenine34) deaminase
MENKPIKSIHDWMKIALCEAGEAGKRNEIPVGAVIVKDNVLLAKAGNTKEQTKNVVAHAEINAITKASSALDSWKLTGCDMYVTLEPCPICAGAIIQSRIRSLYIGACDNRWGCAGSATNLFNIKSFNHKVFVYYSIMEDESKKLLDDFFKRMRNAER